MDKIAVKKLYAAIQQDKDATYWPRRRPYDSEINPETTIIDNYDFLRALPEHLPAFFYLDNVKVELKLHIDYKFEFDNDKIELIDFSNEIH
jgi:methionyl-tRNA formyltransferase